MLYLILFSLLLLIIEAFLCKKKKKLGLIIPIVAGIYVIYSFYKVVKYQDLTYIDMLPSMIIFVPNVITFVVCKIIYKNK